jgi:hypothetical protein
MQINRTGYWLLALFFVGGVAFWFALGTSYLLGPFWVLTAIGLGIYAILQARQGKHEVWLWKNGLRGKGTLVSAKAGALINEQPRMRFELDLDVPGQGRRRVTRNVIVSNFAAPLMQPGLVLPVYVNPNKADDLLIVW